MSDDQLFRLMLLIGFVIFMPVGIYHRLKARTGEKLDRRQEGLFILVTLRLVGHRGLSALVEATSAGDATAGKYLVETAIEATALLPIVERTQPDLLRAIARKGTRWPILASDEAGWEKKALRRVADLKLGADLLALKVHFREPRGTDSNLPARRWARAAVRTIEEPLSDKLGLWTAARYAVAARKLAAAADDCELNWSRLRELCNDVVALRRGDHSAARLKIEQARLEREREETEEEAVAHFQRWAQNPKVRAAICGECVSPEERERRMREIFGLAPQSKPQNGEPATGTAGDGAEPTGAGPEARDLNPRGAGDLPPAGIKLNQSNSNQLKQW